MSERTSNERRRRTNPENKTGELKWDVDSLEEMRRKQKALTNESTEGIDPYDRDARRAAKQEVFASFDERARQAVEGSGVTEEDDPVLFKSQVDYLRRFSIDNMQEDEWQFGTMDDDGNRSPSGRETVREDYKDSSNDVDPHADPDTDPKNDPNSWESLTLEERDEIRDRANKDNVEWDEVKAADSWDEAHAEKQQRESLNESDAWDAAHNEHDQRAMDDIHETANAENAEWEGRTGNIEALRDKLEALSTARDNAFAERMRAPTFNKTKQAELQAVFEAADAEYLAAVKEYEAAMIGHDRVRAEHSSHKVENDGTLTRTKEDDAIEAELNEALSGRINARFADDEQGRLDAMLEQGGVRAKLLNKFANLSTGKKIAVSVGASLVLVGAGAGAAVVAGAVGVAAGGAGAAALVAGRFGRGYAARLSQLYANRDAESLPQFEAEPASNQTDALAAAEAFLKNQAEEEIKSGDKIKKRAVYAGVGAVALGGALGYGVGVASDWVSDRPSGWVGGKIGDAIQDSFAGGDGDPAIGTDFAPAPPAPEVVTPVVEYDSDALTIDKGEGWYQTFREMGIPKEDWSSLLKEVGPKLPDDIAYLDSGSGEWRISMTPDGKMPTEALDAIREAYEGNLDTAVAPEVPDTDISGDNGAAETSTGTGDSGASGEAAGASDGTPDNSNKIVGGNPADIMQQGADTATGADSGADVAADNAVAPGEVAEVVEPADYSALTSLEVPDGVPSEQFMQQNGLGNAWLEINKPSVAAELINADPSAFNYVDGSLALNGGEQISEEAWGIIADHMSNVEKERYGLAG